MRSRPVGLILVLLILPSLARGGGPPSIAGIAPDLLADHVRQVVAGLDALKQPLPPTVRTKLDAALVLPDPAARSVSIQAAIDPECLLTLTIGPESRVSLTAGPARPDLEQDAWRTFLVKVENPSGSTSELHLRPSRSFPRHFDLADAPPALLPARLNGRPVEYRLGRISPRGVGRYPLGLSVQLPGGTTGRDHEVRLDVALTSHPQSAMAPDVREPGHSNSLAVAEAEADRLDPGWRLTDLEAHREVYPPDRNGALRILEILKRLPAEPDEFKAGKGPWADLEPVRADPTRKLSPKLIEAIHAWLDPLGPTLTKARALEGFAGGRFPRVYARNFYKTLLPDIQESRNLIRVLDLDALARADRGEPDAALASCRAILAVGRSIGDEPLSISQLVRMAGETIALRAIERTLAQGEPTDESLAKTQALLADEAAQPLLLHALRGERAGMDDLIGKAAKGEIDIKEFVKELSGENLRPPAVADQDPALYREDQAYGLLMATRLVEIGKRPMRVQKLMMDRLEAELTRSDQPIPLHDVLLARRALPRLLLPGLGALSASYCRTRAQLRCSELAIALERTRRKLGRWPLPGESLAPALAGGPPNDPYTETPLRWKPIESGLLIYSVGPDVKDDGGNLNNAKPLTPGTDVGYRLWDVPRRAQEPRP